MSATVFSKPRRYPRASPAQPSLVAWRSPTRNNISRFTSLGLGGMFIHETNPPPSGALLQLIIETPSGQVRARATVCTAESGRGMGVQFTQMGPEERSRLAYMIKKLLS
jgi:hypothetical protein